MRFSSFLICGLTAMAVTSCANKEAEAPVTEFATYSGSHTYILSGLKSDFGEDNDMTECDSVSLILPVRLAGKETPALRDSILARALDGVDTRTLTPRKAIETWLDTTAAQSGCPVVPTDINAGLADGFVLVQGTVTNLTPKLMTYCIATSSLLPGAANGLYTLDYINYSIETESIITLKDLFTPEGLAALPGVIADKAESMAAYAGNVSIETLPESPGGFFISSEGEIVFSYQPMEVGPHSLGNVQVLFTPEELVDYMTAGAVKAFNLSDLR